MSPLMISIAAFVGVSALVGAVAVMLRERTDGRTEDRLDLFAAAGGKGARKEQKETVLLEPLDDHESALDQFLNEHFNLTRLFEQADTSLKPATFFLISAIFGGLGGAVAAYFSPLAMVPVIAILMGLLPLMWLLFRRSRRLKAFAAQLPDALELIARALRAGHSLAAGFHLVQDEMPSPIAGEFGRVFEEQNLGVPFEESLEALSTRIPNTDLRFFTTAIILQRQTGGDLAEILDKIGHLIRERFRIWGQVQALTGEGRLSGIVLLGLPPVLFLAVYHLNPTYVMVLFTDPMGKQMLAGGVVMQILGALVIRKIINIKV
ncbi:MAG: type II secretion system F family protein [Pirellulales bacterium]|nr:type II secretion system F family protein [Pirellulales bacterium]